MVWEAVFIWHFSVERLFLEVVKKCQNVLEIAEATAASCGDVIGPTSWQDRRLVQGLASSAWEAASSLGFRSTVALMALTRQQ